MLLASLFEYEINKGRDRSICTCARADLTGAGLLDSCAFSGWIATDRIVICLIRKLTYVFNRGRVC